MENFLRYLPYLADLVTLGLGALEKYTEGRKTEELTPEELAKFIEIAKGNVEHWKDL